MRNAMAQLFTIFSLPTLSHCPWAIRYLTKSLLLVLGITYLSLDASPAKSLPARHAFTVTEHIAAPANTAPVNDQCTGAITLLTGQTVAVSTVDATTINDPIGGPCTQGDEPIQSNPGVFYRFVGTGQQITVSTNTSATGNYDTQLYVFSGSCNAFACVGSNNDFNGQRYSQVTFLSRLNRIYYFFVQGYGSGTGAQAPTGQFGLSVSLAGLPDLVVSSSPAYISGAYNNVTITGSATLSGSLMVNGSLTVQAGGSLAINCQPLTGPGSCTIAAGATLKICNPAGITRSGATGAVQLSGLRNFSPDANYVYNGTVAQLTGDGLPSRVQELAVTNPTGLTLSQPLSVSQRVLLQTGNLHLNGYELTLLSTTAGTALISNLGGRVLGNTGQLLRSIDPALNPGLGYRHYGSPVTGMTVSQLASPGGFTPIVNPAYNALPHLNLAAAQFPNVFDYQESRLSATFPGFDTGWHSPAALTDQLLPSKGYSLFLPATTLLRFIGTFNTGPQSSGPLTRSSAALSETGWQLLGNPYPSPIDWSTVAPAQRPGLDGAMYVYESTGQYTGSFRSYVNGFGSSSLIDAGAGYFVRVSSATVPGRVDLTDANRVTEFGLEPSFARRTAADQRPQLQLKLHGTLGADETTIYFEQGATIGVDAAFDAIKLANPSGWNLSSQAGSTSMAINGLPALSSTNTVVVPLLLQVPAAGNLILEATNLAHFGAYSVYLNDAAQGTQLLLAAGTRYQFTLALATAASTRFSLLFRPTSITASQPALASSQISIYPNPAQSHFTVQLPPVAGQKTAQLTLSNSLGQTISQRTLSLSPAGLSTEYATQALAPGVYVLNVRIGNSSTFQRVVVE
jgi:hypothetical protein